MRKELLVAAIASSGGLFALLGYPALKTVYPIKNKASIVDDYLDLPTATADLTKDISLPEGVGSGTDKPVYVSHWILLSLLKSKRDYRRETALEELARHRRWNDGECLEIAQALERQDIIKLARTVDADIRLFLPPPSMSFIEKTLNSDKIEKLVKTILKDVSESLDSCSSCTNFYTNLSLRIRPDSNALAMNELDQVDKMMHSESRKRKRSLYNEDLIKLKAVLNNVICGEKQAISMVQSGMLLALLYFRQKYPNDVQINGVLAQILANLSVNKSTRDYVFVDGWIRTLVQYSRSDQLEQSLPAVKALSNLDDDRIKQDGIYGNHVYLLSPFYRDNHADPVFDLIFVHGLVGSVFKSWRQGSVALDEFGNPAKLDTNNPPLTELKPAEYSDNNNNNNNNNNTQNNGSTNNDINKSRSQVTKCWPKDWLPEDVSGLRILALDYPSALSNWRTDCDQNKDNLKERANLVFQQLRAANIGDRPIIWVAHSMGGLLVKQILVNCDEACKATACKAKNKDDTSSKKTQQGDQSGSSSSSDNITFKQNILNQTKGIVFYSVPHKGSNLGWIERKNLQKLLLLTTEVIELQKSSPMLLELHEKFLNLSNQNIRFLSYGEDSISSFGVNKVVQWKGVLVHEDSLHFDKGENIKLKIDHAHTCKPNAKNSITYVRTLQFIKSIVPQKKQEDEDEELRAIISFFI